MPADILSQRWETIQAQCDDTELRGLSQQHIVALLGITPMLRWTARYIDDVSAEALNDFVDEIETRLASNMVQDNCELKDCYGNVVFDFAICLRSIGFPETLNDAIENTVNNYTTYDGDTININDGYADPSNAATCYIIRQLIELVCGAVIAVMTEEHEENIELMSDVIGAVGDIITILSEAMMAAGHPIAGLAGIGLGLGYSLVSVFWEDIYEWELEDDIVPYEDEEAKDIVACLIFSSIGEAKPVYSEWAVAADGALTGNAELIREKVAVAIANEDVFADLLTVLAPALSIAEYLPGAEMCEQCENWLRYFLFYEPSGSDPDTTYDDGGWEQHVYGNMWSDPDPVNAGVHVTTEGWLPEDILSGAHHDMIRFVLSSPTTINFLQLECTPDTGNVTSFHMQLGYGDESGNGVVLFSTEAKATVLFGGEITPQTMNDLMIAVSYNGGNTDHTIFKLTVKGAGGNPFA